MEVFRRLERRLESLLDGAVAGVFRGPLHPTELADRIAREADLASETISHGERIPNHYRLLVAPEDMGATTPPGRLTRWLGDSLDELSLERGWRLDGPAVVELVTDPDTPRGHPACETSVRPGPRRAWAVLYGSPTDPVPQIDVTFNHAIIGRGEQADVDIDDDTVSRRHAVLWSERGMIFCQDLGSSNGTWLDGGSASTGAIEVPDAARLTFGNASFIVRRR